MTDSTQSPPGSAGSDKANAIIAWIYDLPDGFTRMSHIAPNPGEKAAPLYTVAQEDALDAKRYRWLLDNQHLDFFVKQDYARASTRKRKINAAIDAAIADAGRGT